MRIGIGYDVHKLVYNRKLILGGVEFKYEKGLLGHSDADGYLPTAFSLPQHQPHSEDGSRRRSFHFTRSRLHLLLRRQDHRASRWHQRHPGLQPQGLDAFHRYRDLHLRGHWPDHSHPRQHERPGQVPQGARKCYDDCLGCYDQHRSPVIRCVR